MVKTRTVRRVGLVVFLLAAAAWSQTHACSVCFGDPESDMVKGAMSGVWFMLGVVGMVQVSFALFFFVYLRKRARIYRDGSLKPVFEVVETPADKE
jgi:hypothetical protein